MKEGIEIDNNWVCLDCGKEYMEENKFPLRDGVSTAHMGKCCVCHEEKTVMHERNYRWLARWKFNKTR